MNQLLVSCWDQVTARISTAVRRRTNPEESKAGRKMLSIFGKTRAGFNRIYATLFAPVDRLIKRLIVVSENLSVRISNDPRLRILFAPVRLLFGFLASLVEFIAAWLSTRNYRSLIMGIPAMLLMMLLVLCLIRIPLHSAYAKARHYQSAATEASNNNQPHVAELYYRKLAQLGVDRPSAIFDQARMLAKSGDVAQAYEKMKTIAPIDASQYANAHFWIANSAFTRQLEVPENERFVLIETHLKHTLKQYPNHPLATQLLARVYRESGRIEEGQNLINSLRTARSDAVDRVRLAETYMKLEKEEKAIELANMAIAEFSNAFANQNTITAQEWVMWSLAEKLAGHPEEAVKIMADAYANTTENEWELLNENAPRLVNHILNQLWEVGDRQTWLNSSKAAMKATPLRAELQTSLITRAFQDPDLAGEIRSLLASNESVESMSPRTQRMLADLALSTGDFKAARNEYRNILQTDPENQRILNNLAWLTGNTSPIDLDSALEFANQAVTLDETHASTRETRGQLLLKLRRWEAAAKDLEFALNGLPSSIEIHQSLARCYDELGERELADSHRARFDASR
ncbi:MAG: hypothetical protein GY768_26820 [Planctomycetaceae bacterium]|nr:hypothetical protein [Planctomycetaceae bacterium]